MKSLVTGGAGFIGSHLCERLLSEGATVICIDNLLTGSRSNIEPLLSNDSFTFMEHDVSDTSIHTALDQLSQSIDHIYHLASPASPVWYMKYPLETLHVNSIGTENMLKIAQRHNARLVYTSTSEVYGDPLEHPQKETYWGNVNSYGPRSCYDEAKRYGEALVYTYVHTHNVDARIVRIFNTYGPRMDPNDGRVISNLVNQAIRGIPMTIYGDGQQTRSYCYVSDMVSGIIKMMQFEDGAGHVVNLGNPDERTVQGTVRVIKKISESKSDIEFKKRPTDDPLRRKPDITRAQQLLNWTPVVSFEDGVAQTISYFKNLAT